MAKFAPVAPVQVLSGMLDHGRETFGSYHLLLAHHTVEKADEFTDLWQRLHANGPFRPTVIMDNSIVELGASESFETVARATNIIVNASEGESMVIPVLPDAMADGAETRALIEKHYDQWSRNMGGNGFMAVLQGNTQEEFLATAEFVLSDDYPEITWLGIPRVLVQHVGSRIPALQSLYHLLAAKGKLDKYNVHLLGFSDDMMDDWRASQWKAPPADGKRPYQNSFAQGIDSAVPLRVEGQFNLAMQPGPRPADWFDTAVFDERVALNLHIARECFAVTR